MYGILFFLDFSGAFKGRHVFLTYILYQTKRFEDIFCMLQEGRSNSLE